ncbi:MAG: hypothetical protein AAF420_08770 [Pseudomonadota bacterium]
MAPTNTHSTILWFSTLSAFALVLSLLLPRLVDFSNGFAGATSAALLFLSLFVIAVVLAIIALVYTLKNFGSARPWYRLMGIGPCVIIVVVAVVFFLKLST